MTMLRFLNERNKLDIEKLFQLCSTLLHSVINYTQKWNDVLQQLLGFTFDRFLI